MARLRAAIVDNGGPSTALAHTFAGFFFASLGIRPPDRIKRTGKSVLHESVRMPPKWLEAVGL